MNVLSRILGLCVAAFAMAAPAAAQTPYPTKPVTLIVGFAPGGGNDTVGRLVAEQLGKQLGQSVVVENMAGADGAIAAQYVANAAPDGYTLLSGSSGMMVYNPSLNSALRYQPLRDFTPISLVGYSQFVFSVTPSLPVKTLPELIRYAKANPDKLFYASPSSPHRVAFEAFKDLTGTDIRHVPYKGSGPAIMAAVSGEVQVLVSSVSDVLQHTRNGKLKPLAVTGTERSSFMPDVPTAIESGVNFESLSWIGLYAPRNTAPEVANRLSLAMAKVMQSESFKKSLIAVGYEQYPVMTPEQFVEYQRNDVTRWGKVIRDLKLQTQ